MRAHRLAVLVASCALLVVALKGLAWTSPAPAPVIHNETKQRAVTGNARDRSAQAAARSQSAATLPKLPIKVNGAETPELIPDRLAYHHFLKAAAAPSDPAARQARIAWMLARVQLSDSDTVSITAALEGIGEELNAIPAGGSLEAVESSRRTRDEVLDGARMRIVTSLSADGKKSLDKHIQEHVKRRIRIYGDPVHH